MSSHVSHLRRQDLRSREDRFRFSSTPASRPRYVPAVSTSSSLPDRPVRLSTLSRLSGCLLDDDVPARHRGPVLD